MIAVSHDRYFLRRIATRIVTVDSGKLVDYQGDYEVRWGSGRRWAMQGNGSMWLPLCRLPEPLCLPSRQAPSLHGCCQLPATTG